MAGDLFRLYMKKSGRAVAPAKDIEVVKTLLNKIPVPWTEDREVNGNLCISVERGYAGFVTVFRFTKDGALKDIGAYE